MRGLELGLAMVLLLSPAVPAEAHRPVSIGGTLPEGLVIKEPEISQVLYAELRTPKQLDTIRFTGRKGETVLLQLGIPQIASLKDFRPQAALIGPGLPSEVTLPFGLPPGSGAMVYAFDPKESFFEPFTRTSSWTGKRFEASLPANGEYRVVVYAAEGTGKYWLAIGEKEVFGVGDWLSLPLTIWKVRRFHEIPAWGDALWIAGTVGAISLIVWRFR